MGKKKCVFITGTSGNMGAAGLEALLKEDTLQVRTLVRPSEKNKELMKRYSGSDLEIIWGDLTRYEDVLKCVTGADYVLHCAAFVSPAADAYPEEAMKINLGSNVNLVRAIKAQPDPDAVKFVHIGTIAQTGDRMPPIHWGRVGDPIKPSVHDYYAVSKVAAERYVIEAGLKNWVSLRQTGILSMGMMRIVDGISSHNPFNNVLEFVTDHDSGVLLRNACQDDIPESFWGHIYNIGGGESCRVSNYHQSMAFNKYTGMSFEDYKRTVEPSWKAVGNFHGTFYLDSDKLNDVLHFQSQGVNDFAREVFAKLAAMTPPNAPRKSMEERILESRKRNLDCAHMYNGLLHWLEENDKDHIQAFLISKQNWANIPDWDSYHLMTREEYDVYNKISHGYDDSMPQTELTLEMVQEAAKFRGGHLLSPEMQKGDWATKLDWECAFGHKFKASNHAILEGGHWCPVCERESWNYHEVAKRSEFMAQVWYPLHDVDEPSRTYPKRVNESLVLGKDVF